jgi:hypothetical protein
MTLRLVLSTLLFLLRHRKQVLVGLVWRAERVGMIAGSTFVIKSIGGDEGGMLPKSVEWQHY